MPLFGTPKVVGTLSSSTSQTTYTVPITTTTGLGDSIIVIVGSGGGGTNNIPNSVTDSQNTNLNYQQVVPAAQNSGTLTYWQIFNSKVFTNTDTITVTFPVANAFLKNIIVLDCPGIAPSPLAIDQLSVSSGTGTGTPVIGGAGATTFYELIIIAEQNSNAGGSPSILSGNPFTSLITLHSGSAEYTNASYWIQVLPVGVGQGYIYGATITGSTAPWQVIGVGYYSSVPVFADQFPFPVQVLPPSFAFNPALSSIRVTPGQPPNPLPSTNVSVAGVTANVNVAAPSGQAFIYTPSAQQFQLNPNGIPYPLSMIGGLQFLPRQIQTGPFAIFQAAHTATVTVAAPNGIPTIFQNFAPQFPWQSIFPYSLQFNPSLSWLRVQYSTANKPTYIDGGTGGQVTVNAQFPDIAVTISVSPATPNVSVVAPVPSASVSGPTANVSVVAPNGTVVIADISVSSPNISVHAIAGSVSVSPAGVAASVNAASPNGTVTLTPVGPQANVNVASPSGSLTVAIPGSAGAVTVASTGSVARSIPGPVSNVGVVAPFGTVTETVLGSVSSVAVASTGAVTLSVPASASSVTVTAPPGIPTIVHVLAGVTATIIVASSGIANVSVPAPSISITVSAPAGSVPLNITGPTANVSVSAPAPDFAGVISVTGTLVNPDLAMDQLLSRQGRLLVVPVEDVLISATKPPQEQGI
jgi:hypothetical protein